VRKHILLQSAESQNNSLRDDEAPFFSLSPNWFSVTWKNDRSAAAVDVLVRGNALGPRRAFARAEFALFRSILRRARMCELPLMDGPGATFCTESIGQQPRNFKRPPAAQRPHSTKEKAASTGVQRRSGTVLEKPARKNVPRGLRSAVRRPSTIWFFTSRSSPGFVSRRCLRRVGVRTLSQMGMPEPPTRHYFLGK